MKKFDYTVTTKDERTVEGCVIYPEITGNMIVSDENLLSEVISVIETNIKSKAREIDRTGENPLEFPVDEEGKIVIDAENLHKVFTSTDEILVAQYKRSLLEALRTADDDSDAENLMNEITRFNSLTKTEQKKLVIG